MRKVLSILFFLSGFFLLLSCVSAKDVSSESVLLDGEDWRLAIDPNQVGKEQKWWESVQAGAKQTKVPWIIQDAFPGYHGLAWYWKEFTAPKNPHRNGRYILKFWSVDYKSDIWLNDVKVGEYEGSESVFAFDVTDVIKPGGKNRLAVRVLNPTYDMIEGITLNQTPHRCNAIPMAPGNGPNEGGILDSVELLVVPAVYISDVYVKPDAQTGELAIETTVVNPGEKSENLAVEYMVTPYYFTKAITYYTEKQKVKGDGGVFKASLKIDNHRLWDVDDPYLYNLEVRVRRDDSDSFDAFTTRFGFRDFRFESGFFRLNGKRIFLKSSHDGNCFPVGQRFPHDPAMLRATLLQSKVMNMNMIRIFGTNGHRSQVRLCDEMGLLVYSEHPGSWLLDNSDYMKARFDESVRGAILRDRNYPSIVMWGLLNETFEGAVLEHAIDTLPLVRSLDDTRMVMLDSGWHGFVSPGLHAMNYWHDFVDSDMEEDTLIRDLNEQISRFHIIGPFENANDRDGSAGLKAVFPPEEKIDLTASYDGKNGKITWKEVQIKAGDYYDLLKHVDTRRNITAYAYTMIDSPVDATVLLRVKSDDGMAVWVNGQQLLCREVVGTALFSPLKIPVTLKKGRNELLIEVDQGWGWWGFTVEFYSDLSPLVGYNGTERTMMEDNMEIKVGHLVMKPKKAANGDTVYSAVRWTADKTDEYDIKALFKSACQGTTADVYVLQDGKIICQDAVNLNGRGSEVGYNGKLKVEKGQSLDFAVGYGSDKYETDLIDLLADISSADSQTTYNPARQFSKQDNSGDLWQYGYIRTTGDKSIEEGTFTRYQKPGMYQGYRFAITGNFSNPGSNLWQQGFLDVHPYKGAPHTRDTITQMRSADMYWNRDLGKPMPIFASEYGVGSAINLPRILRQYEQLGRPDIEDPKPIRKDYEKFLKDWNNWKMAEVFARPEEFFEQSVARMASLREEGINALRANPYLVGYSLTGTTDAAMSPVGEGLVSFFRELKPGTVDVMADVFSKLRWCNFVEPVHIYSGDKVNLETVLANEDQLLPGEYPVRVMVVGPDHEVVFQKSVTFTVPNYESGKEPSYVIPVFKEDVLIEGQTGRYRFIVDFEKGAAAAGGTFVFHVMRREEMPAVEAEVVLWGEDEQLFNWLKENHIKISRFDKNIADKRQVILAAGAPASPGGAEVFRDLAQRMARGSSVIFLMPEIFKKDNEPLGWAPLAKKGEVVYMPHWVYHVDDWNRIHPVFGGLPCGGLTDWRYYRDMTPTNAWVSTERIPEEVLAATIDASFGYNSGLLLSRYNLGTGEFFLSVYPIRQRLGVDPVAERMLRNLLNYAGRNISQPLSELPADFEEEMKKIGY